MTRSGAMGTRCTKPPVSPESGQNQATEQETCAIWEPAKPGWELGLCEPRGTSRAVHDPLGWTRHNPHGGEQPASTFFDACKLNTWWHNRTSIESRPDSMCPHDVVVCEFSSTNLASGRRTYCGRVLPLSSSTWVCSLAPRARSVLGADYFVVARIWLLVTPQQEKVPKWALIPHNTLWSMARFVPLHTHVHGGPSDVNLVLLYQPIMATSAGIRLSDMFSHGSSVPFLATEHVHYPTMYLSHSGPDLQQAQMSMCIVAFDFICHFRRFGVARHTRAIERMFYQKHTVSPVVRDVFSVYHLVVHICQLACVERAAIDYFAQYCIQRAHSNQPGAFVGYSSEFYEKLLCSTHRM